MLTFSIKSWQIEQRHRRIFFFGMVSWRAMDDIWLCPARLLEAGAGWTRRQSSRVELSWARELLSFFLLPRKWRNFCAWYHATFCIFICRKARELGFELDSWLGSTRLVKSCSKLGSTRQEIFQLAPTSTGYFSRYATKKAIFENHCALVSCPPKKFLYQKLNSLNTSGDNFLLQARIALKLGNWVQKGLK